MDAWMIWMKDNLESLKAFARGDEDIWNIVVDRLPRIFELWDPELCEDRDRYVWGALSNYRRKWLCRQRRTINLSPDFDIAQPHNRAHEVYEYIAVKLDPDTRRILLWHYIDGYTHAEIARACNCKVALIKEVITDAIATLRRSVANAP